MWGAGLSDERPLYADFLGTWILDPSSCVYEQGEPPRSGSYRIEEFDGALVFHISWVDAEGASQQAEFSGVPDGKPVPFAGGELADALSVRAVSARELRSSAYHGGRELMVAQRQLDATNTAMRVVQLVRMLNGPDLGNTSVYRKEFLN
jgi:hypothetical protein